MNYKKANSKPVTTKRLRVASASALGVAISLCLTPPPVYASGALEEVIVTARKREENLQTLPQAITALQSDQLEAAQVSNITNLAAVIPNVSIHNTVSTGSPHTLGAIIRGIGNEQGFAPGVGIYIDDVYLATAMGAVLDVYDLERIEVLKGPQGNLYGRNTIGGAIRYITRDPSDERRLSVEAKVGSFNRRDVKASASGPLIENMLYGGVAISRVKTDGYQTNVVDGRKFGADNSWAGRATLKLTPTENFSAKWVSDFTYENGLPELPKRIYTAPGFAAANPTDPLIDPKAIGIDQVSFKANAPLDWYGKSMTHALTLSWDISDAWTAKSISAYRLVANKLIQDLDGSAILALETDQTRRNAARSQEFQFNYSGDSVDGVIGLYYFKESEPNTQISTFGPALNGPVVGYVYRDARTTSNTKSAALYTSWDFDLSDDWHLTLGARKNHDSADATLRQIDYIPNFGLAIDGGTTKFSKSWDKITKTIRLSYDVSPDTMTYIGYAEGYKQGGFNTNGGTLAISLGKSSYDPEMVKTYTVGFKTTQLKQTLRINAEWFYNDYRDKLLSVISANPVDPTQLLQINENAGAIHTTGVDVDFNWSTPVNGLTINAGLGYLQAVIDKYKASQWNSTGTGLINPEMATNYRMAFSPRWTANLSPIYTLDMADDGTLQFAGTVNFRDKEYLVSPTNITEGYAQGTVSAARVIYNATMSWTTPDEHWRVALEGRNLSNRRVLEDGFNIGSTLFALGGYSEPRTWAASVRYQLQ